MQSQIPKNIVAVRFDRNSKTLVATVAMAATVDWRL